VQEAASLQSAHDSRNQFPASKKRLNRWQNGMTAPEALFPGSVVHAPSLAAWSNNDQPFMPTSFGCTTIIAFTITFQTCWYYRFTATNPLKITSRGLF
jgi:hypothetical protein